MLNYCEVLRALRIWSSGVKKMPEGRNDTSYSFSEYNYGSRRTDGIWANSLRDTLASLSMETYTKIIHGADAARKEHYRLVKTVKLQPSIAVVPPKLPVRPKGKILADE